MARIISPSRPDLSATTPPLQPGELHFVDRLDAILDKHWEIYVQPYLNGCRPDIVVLNPQVGVGVFEVKDWDLHPDRYFVRDDLRGFARIHFRGDQEVTVLRSPLDQLLMYRREIFDLYCPRLGRTGGVNPVFAGLVFPFARDRGVMDVLSRLPERQAFSRSGSVIWGADALRRNAPADLFSCVTRRRDFSMNPALADDLRSWLVEPAGAAARRQPIRLNVRQADLAQNRTESGFRRIRGPAGSGKSLVLAARAATLSGEGKSVLVITYNITLAHYLRDLCARRPGGDPNRITWLHFHGWCKRIACMLGFFGAYGRLWGSFGGGIDEIPKLVLSELRSLPPADKALYDAILVDEGQDFEPSWWEALRQTLKPGGEMLLAADVTQDTYGKARAWTEDVMKGAGFSGPWNDLASSYRLPPSLASLAALFAERYLPREWRIDPLSGDGQGELDLTPCALRWVQTFRTTATAVCCDEALRAIRIDEERNRSIGDLTLLTDNTADGRNIERRLNARKIRTTTTFAFDPSPDNAREDQRKKLAFWKGNGRVRITTLHSFKGWEARLVTLNITRAATARDLNVIYTGLTRLKRHERGSQLTVVCSVDHLRAFGRHWPDFEDQVQRG